MEVYAFQFIEGVPKPHSLFDSKRLDKGLVADCRDLLARLRRGEETVTYKTGDLPAFRLSLKSPDWVANEVVPDGTIFLGTDGPDWIAVATVCKGQPSPEAGLTALVNATANGQNSDDARFKIFTRLLLGPSVLIFTKAHEGWPSELVPAATGLALALGCAIVTESQPLLLGRR